MSKMLTVGDEVRFKTGNPVWDTGIVRKVEGCNVLVFWFRDGSLDLHDANLLEVVEDA